MNLAQVSTSIHLILCVLFKLQNDLILLDFFLKKSTTETIFIP